MGPVQLTRAASVLLLTSLPFTGCSSAESGSSGATAGAAGAAGAGANTSGGASSGGSGAAAFGGSGFGFGGSAAGGGGRPSCEEELIESRRQPAHVMLVLDISGSMRDGFDGAKDPPAGSDKWSAMRDALGAALGETADVGFGLISYPRADSGCGANCCEVPAGSAAVEVEISDAGVGAVSDSLASIVPVGGTPTAAALERAAEYFQQGAGKDLDGAKYVLLATDGGPNCDGGSFCAADACIPNMLGTCQLPGSANCCGAQAPCDRQGNGAAPAECVPLWQQCLDEDGAVAQVEALAALGVQTFVLGMPGVEAFDSTLNALAIAGGQAQSGQTKYFQVTSSGGADELVSQLRSITGQLIKRCEFEVTPPPGFDPGLTNVEIDGQVVPQADNWEFDDSVAPPVVRLLGTACDNVEQRGAEAVRISFGCPTIIR